MRGKKRIFAGMETGIDIVSLLVLRQLERGCVLEDPAVPYGSPERLDLLEAEELLRLYWAVRERVTALGIDAAAAAATAEPRGPEILRISDRYRIFLPERGGEELRLRPLAKTLFIFFLKHPEGVQAKCLGDFRDELLAIYGRITGRDDAAAVAATVDRLVDATNNSLHENCSRLNARLSAVFPKETLDQYRIQGSYAGLRRIALERMYVRWEER